MNNEAQTQQQDEAIIQLEGEDGNTYFCQILDIFEFDNQDYALLLKLADKDKQDSAEEEDDGLVIMRLITRDEQSIFQTIESDEEFEKVVKHVEEMARQAELEGAADD
jgi:uncharacterized protein YrzB (UPF0473 family)